MGHLGTSNGSGRVFGEEVKRLDSWKEIAAYFGKDVRTVRRWERDRHLPVHRIPGSERSGVFAYVPELVSWLHRAKPEEEDVKEFVRAQESGIQAIVGERRKTPGRRATDSRVDQPIAMLDSASTPDVTISAKSVVNTPEQRRRQGTLNWFRLHVGVWLTLLAGVTLVAALPFVPAQRAGVMRRFLPPAGSRNADVRNLYLRGRIAWNLRTEASLQEAVDLFTQAIVQDPGYAPAYIGLADSYILLRQYGHMPDAEAFPRAMAASEQALRLDHGSVAAHRTHAMLVNSWLWNFPAAEREFQRAIALDPKDAQSHHWYATALQSEGRFSDAVREIEIARQLDPDSPVVQANRGLLLQYVDLDEATKELQKIEVQYPTASFVHSHLARAYLRKNDILNFVKEQRQRALLLPDDAEAALLDEVQREDDGATPEAVLVRLAEGYGKLTEEGGQYATRASYLYALLGDAERTLRYLKISSERREDDFRSIGYESVYRFLYGNAEFQALLKMRNTPRGGENLNQASVSFLSKLRR